MLVATLRRFLGAALLVILTGGVATAQQTELTWYGQSAFKIVTPSGRVLFVDPWIVNPANPSGKEALAAINKADLILITHGHGDHVGNAVEIAKKTGAQLVATFDLMRSLVQYRGYPKEQAGMATGGNFGGELRLLDGDVKVAFVPAIHSSAVDVAPGMADEGALKDGGNPGGFVISIKDGPTIYHAGDTDLFSDLALVASLHSIDLFLVPIGDKFTMGPARAAQAAKLVNPAKAIIPMHYGTFPALTGTPAAFKDALAKLGVTAPMREMTPGQGVMF